MFKVFKASGIESSYSISANPLFSTDGWTIYPLKHKTTKKQCSVWIFDKKKFENVLQKLGVINKSNKQLVMDDCFQVLKNYVASLIKVKHPHVLHVLENLEDHKSRALFVTEYVVTNLVKIDKQELDEIMITKGLLQISNGVKFLHETLQSVHLNIQPSTIFINENFDWKLSGLNFLQNIESGSGEIDTFDPRMPGFVNVNFRFSSPELIMNRRLSFQHDLFSIGCLIFYLFNCRNVNSSSPYIIGCENNNISEYERDVKKLSNTLQSGNLSVFRNIPENYLNSLTTLLNYQQNQWDINQFMESSIFNNELIKILNFFDSFLSQELKDQYKFLTKFKDYLLKFPKVLLLNKFLPILCDLLDTYTKDPKKQISTEEEGLISAILENLFLISQTLSQLTFMEKVFPRLNQTILSSGLISCKIMIINNLSLIENKLGISDSGNKNYENFGKFLITLFKNGVVSTEVNQQQLMFQERILSNLNVFINFQTYNTISNTIFPDICQLFTKTTSLKIKNLTINAFITLLRNESNSLDNFTITEKLLPILHNTSSKNFKNSEILKNLVLLYEEIFNKLSVKSDSSTMDIILEQIFFQLWKLMKFAKTKPLNSFLVSAIKRIETFLILKNSENLTNEDESVISPMASPPPSIVVASKTTNNIQNNIADGDEDDDFGDFNKNTVKPASRLQLKPNQSNVLSFGSTSTNNTSSMVSALKPQQASNPIRQQHTTTTTTTGSIDWSVESQKPKTPITFNPRPQQQQQQPVLLPQQNNSSFPPGFSMNVIQPVKKPSTPVQNQQQQQDSNGWSFGESLI